MCLFDAEALYKASAERLAAIEFCGGDSDKADAIIASGNFIFVQGVCTVEALGGEAYCAAIGKRHNKRFLSRNVDTLGQGEQELELSGGKLTRYGFFQLRHGKGGFKRGFIEQAVRRRELAAAIDKTATDVLGEMLAEGFKFFK